MKFNQFSGIYSEVFVSCDDEDNNDKVDTSLASSSGISGLHLFTNRFLNHYEQMQRACELARWPWSSLAKPGQAGIDLAGICFQGFRVCRK